MVEQAGRRRLARNLTQTILLLHGPGGANKGTISNIIQRILGELNCYELRTDHLDERFEIFRYIVQSCTARAPRPRDAEHA